MSHRVGKDVRPRNGERLVVGIVARISGCASQKEVSLEDQIDHAKEEVKDLYDGPVDYKIFATKGKGEQTDRPELKEIEEFLRSKKADLLVMEDVGRLVRGVEAVQLWGIAVDHGVRCIAPSCHSSYVVAPSGLTKPAVGRLVAPFPFLKRFLSLCFSRRDVCSLWPM